MARKKRPPKCCKPDCFNCPYVDCRYDGMDTNDYTETNIRDYQLYEDSTGRKYHKGADKAYRTNRQMAYNREHPKKRDQKEYMREYYKTHRDEILAREKEKYDSKKNTIKCRKWRKKNPEHKREYDRQRYLKIKESRNERRNETRVANMPVSS